MEGPTNKRFDRYASFLWQRLPQFASRISTTLAVSLADGAYLYRLDRRLIVLPPLAFMFGLLFGWQHFTFAKEATYTASLIAMGVLMLGGSIGLNLGVFGWLGYIVGEFVLRSVDSSYFPYKYPYTYILRQRVPMMLSYVLLATLLFGIPLVAVALGRTVEKWKLPHRLQRNAARGASAITLVALVYLWAQSTATLIRPVYTWLGNQPTTEAIAPLQKSGWVLSLIAVLGYVVRLFLETRSAANDRTPGLRAKIVSGRLWLSRLSPGARIAISGFGTTVLLSGLFETWFDFAATAAVVIGLRIGRKRVLRRIPQWTALMMRVPLLIRLVAVGGISYWVASKAIGWVWLTSSGTFRPVLMCLFASMVLLVVVLPDLYRTNADSEAAPQLRSPTSMTTLMTVGLMWLLAGPILSADNCGSLNDCYGVIAVAALAVAAIAIAAVLLPVLIELAVGAALETAAAEGAAAAIEVELLGAGGEAGALLEGAGPWVAEAANVTEGGAVAQSLSGSCVSACGEMLSGATVSESELLASLGEWSNPGALADALNAVEGAGTWQGGYFASAADAAAAAEGGPMGATLQAPGLPGHMVVIEPGEAGAFLVRDPAIGASYEVTVEWIMKWVSGGVF